MVSTTGQAGERHLLCPRLRCGPRSAEKLSSLWPQRVWWQERWQSHAPAWFGAEDRHAQTRQARQATAASTQSGYSLCSRFRIPCEDCKLPTMVTRKFKI